MSFPLKYFLNWVYQNKCLYFNICSFVCLLQKDLQKPHVLCCAAAEIKPSCGSDRDADLFRPAGYFIRHTGQAEQERT